MPRLFEKDFELEGVLERAECVKFAEFETSRLKLKLDDCSLDIDSASFGYDVLEIERIVRTTDDIQAAHAKIARVADQLGVTPFDDNTGGKLETYIRRFCPQVLQILIDTNILKPRPDDHQEQLKKATATTAASSS